MTHDTDHPKERVTETEHGVFVPPDEQHVREDGENTDPAEPAEWAENNSDMAGDPDRADAIGTEAIPHRPELDSDKGGDQTEAYTQPATPLDTGTAEDVERTEEAGYQDFAAEDETRAETAQTATAEADTQTEHDMRTVDEDTVAQDIAQHDTDDVAVGVAAVPGQAGPADDDSLWPSGTMDDLRSRWDAVQMRFVDDPPAVASDAKALVGEALAAMREALTRLEGRLDEAGAEATDDTEQLRQRVAHYRKLFTSLLSR